MRRAAEQRDSVEVWLGEHAMRVGTLAYSRQGGRTYSSFVYDPAWLVDAERFEISPDLPLLTDHQYRRGRSKEDSLFHFAIADAEPDGWGRRVIARDHAKQRQSFVRSSGSPPPAALSELDYLLGVDDVSRVGALRFRREGAFLRASRPGGRSCPPVLELRQAIDASHAVERGTETEADLRYLRGRGTSLGGMRPKCSVIEEDGQLAIGKFPSIADDRAVTKGEVLALKLASRAGIDAADARTVYSEGVPVAVVRRFDRTAEGRIPYLSAASMLQAARDEEHSYTEIADQILKSGAEIDRDLAELWRRVVFNLLITNVDDHLANHGFLHVAHGQWRLSPAFDLNPFPDKDPELKTWLSEESGPRVTVDDVLSLSSYFHLDPDAARQSLRHIVNAVSAWRDVARTPDVGMSDAETEAFAPAFEHHAVRDARRLANLEASTNTT